MNLIIITYLVLKGIFQFDEYIIGTLQICCCIFECRICGIFFKIYVIICLIDQVCVCFVFLAH